MPAISSLHRRLGLTGALTAACLLQFVSPSSATTTTTTTFTATITLSATCVINSASTLTFAGQGVLTANVPATSQIFVQCTATTPFNIGLDAGIGSGATVAVRKMTAAGSTVNYSLYTDAGHTTVWGNTVNTDTVADTGDGTSKLYTVYGLVPAQNTPAPGTYNDTVTVTVTY